MRWIFRRPPPSMERLNIRVGRPVISRGPVSGELDNMFSETPTNDGRFRGYSGGSGYTRAIVGDDPWTMFDPGVSVLPPGGLPAQPGSSYECGMWMQDTAKLPSGVIHGFVHLEAGCPKTKGVTYYARKSMGFALSNDDGISWEFSGQIITGNDQPSTSRTTGEGDCTVVNGGDGYYYAYCLRNGVRDRPDWSTIVARAPVGTPQPGNWRKFFAGGWGSPGLGGNATSLGFIGMSAARWLTRDQIILLAINPSAGGVRMYLSGDRTTFAAIPEPLIVLDENEKNWLRDEEPYPDTELIAYISMMNKDDVSDQVGDNFLIMYTYVQPNEPWLKHTYLVTRDVSMWTSAEPVGHMSPQVGVALARWYDAASNDRWSTTAAVPGNYSTYAYEGTFGFLMTCAPALPSVKLEDCVRMWPGQTDHILTWDGTGVAAGYKRLRTAGWVFRDEQPNTVPLYRCYSATLESHFVSNQSDCEGLGANEALYGYALSS